MEKQLLDIEQQRILQRVTNDSSAVFGFGTGYSRMNMHSIGPSQTEINTNDMVVRVKSLLAENNIAQKVRFEALFAPLPNFIFNP